MQPGQPTTATAGAYAFLSHNSADKPQVIRLARELTERGVRVWLDVFELKAGDWWGGAIQQALEGAAIVLACVGANGKGPWHDRELDVARQRGLEIRVVCLPGWRREHTRLGFDDRIADELFDGQAGWSRGVAILAGALATRAPGAGAAALPAAPGGPFAGSPYPGIDRGFGPEHAAWFFGREAETADLIRALHKDRWVWLVGNSGSGKSSVARAGVMSWWSRSADLPGLATVFEPTANATEDLAGALDRALRAGGKPPVDLQRLASAPGGWRAELKARFGGDAHDARLPLLVVVDQAEQIFAYQSVVEGGAGEAVGARLRGTCGEMLRTLWDLATDDELPVRTHVLVVLRADWLHRALIEPVLEPMFRASRTQVTLPGMDDADLRDAIVLPARLAAGAVDDLAVSTLIEEVRGREHGLPLLQLVLQEAWRRVARADRVIRLETIGTHPLEDAIGRLVAEQEAAGQVTVTDAQLDLLVPALIELDDRNAPRRRWLPRSELQTRPERDLLHQALEVLVAARVVVARVPSSADPRDHESDVAGWQLAHEAALTAWGRLAAAIARRSELLAHVAALRRLASEGSPLRGAALRKYEALRDEPSLGAETRSFLHASLDAEADEQRLALAAATAARRLARRRVAVVIGVLALVAIVLAVSAIYARRETRRARIQKAEADVQRNLARQRLSESYTEQGRRALIEEQRPSLAISHLTAARGVGDESVAGKLLFAQATRNLWVTALRGARIRTAVFSPDGTRVLTDGDGAPQVWQASTGQPLLTLDEGSSAAFVADGSRIILEGIDGVRLVDASTGRALTPVIEHPMQNAWFSPDGAHMIVLDDDEGTIRVWDMASAAPVTAAFAPGTATATFSPDGTHVLTTGHDESVRVWSAATGRAVTPPLRPGGRLTSAAFSPDGLRLVTTSDDQTARVWSATTGAQVSPPLLHDAHVESARFSLDGWRLVTVSDGTARIWDLTPPQAAVTWIADVGAPQSVSFSPDGARVLVVHRDDTARVWDATTGQPLTDWLAGAASITNALFSPDGAWVVTSGNDGVARIWSVATGREVSAPLVHERLIDSAAFSPDGSRVLTESAMARLWDVESGRPLTEPFEHKGAAMATSFSPDGSRILTSGNSGEVFARDVATGHAAAPLLQHDSLVWTAAFSADGTRVVTASNDQTARVWDATTGRAVTPPLAHDKPVWSAVFSPDGARVATASQDKTAQIWDAATGRASTPPLAHGDFVRSAAWSPDGTRVVTTSDDKTAQIWDAATGRAVTPPLTHASQVSWAVFDPGGTRVVTASLDGTARVWDAVTSAPVTPPMAHDGDVPVASFGAAGALVLTASTSQGARVWDAVTGQPLTPPFAYGTAVESAVFSPDDTRIVTAAGNTARIWQSTPDRHSLAEWQAIAHCYGGRTIAWSPGKCEDTTHALVARMIEARRTAADDLDRASNLLASAQMHLRLRPRLARTLAEEAAAIYERLARPELTDARTLVRDASWLLATP